MNTPETDSRTVYAYDYLNDVLSSNQPCPTVVPSTWAEKLEIQRNTLQLENDSLKENIKNLEVIVENLRKNIENLSHEPIHH